METARRNGVPVVDFSAKLRHDCLDQYGHGILGNEYFLDHVHPRIEVHQRLAEWIVEAMADEGFIRVDEPLSPEQKQALYDRFLEDLDPSYYAQRDFNLGKVLGWAGKNEEAAEAFQRASRVMHDDPMVHYNLGIVYQKLGQAEPAIARYRTVIRLRPTFAEAHFNMGKSYQMIRDFDAAANAFEAALELMSNDGKTHYNLALCYRELDRFQEELFELEKARELDPELPEIVPLLASVYLREGISYGRKGMFDEAIEVFSKALELDADSGTVHYHLGSLYAAHGQPDSALQHFRKAKDLGIDVPDEVIRELESPTR
jgi:tetratricopeptide (TPR) repeat protein